MEGSEEVREWVMGLMLRRVLKSKEGKIREGRKEGRKNKRRKERRKNKRRKGKERKIR